MPTTIATRIRPATLIIALILCSPQIAHAASVALEPNCSASGTTVNCRLLGLLHFLYGAAGILALVLIGVVLLAVRFYRRNKTNPRAGE